MKSPLFSLLLAAALAIPVFASDDAKDANDSKDKKDSPLPLKPARNVDFTTSQGTWLSLDVSPDGKTLVLELVGDLYTLPFSGGEARKITSGMGFNSMPRFSPDGKKIAFISDRGGAENVWISDADGSDARQLSQDEQSEFASPTWTPDGNYVIASRFPQFPVGSNELWMYHIKGGAGVQVTKSKPKPDAPPNRWVNALGPSMSKDGRYLYYTARTNPQGFYNVVFPLSQIVRRNMITGEEDTVTDAPGSAMRSEISPDGKLLVYATRTETETGLRIRDLQSGEERWLKYPVQRDDQESLFTRDMLPNYAFTPDGKELVAAYGGKIHRISVADSSDTEIPFTAKISRELGPDLNLAMRVDEGPVKLRLIQQPVQSPNGKRLAFSALTHLYVMDIPSGTPKRLTSSADHEFMPAWSPDGQWIAFSTWNSVAGGHIWKIRADGSGSPQQLTRVAAYYRDLNFSPDGSRIVAIRGPRQGHVEQLDEWDSKPVNWDVIWLPSDGGDVNLILPARGAADPHFGPEPDRVYIYSQAGLISTRYDGTDRRTILRILTKSWFPDPDSPEGDPADDIRISPDGKWALAQSNNQVYLLAVARTGDGPVTVDLSRASVPLRKLTDVGGDYLNFADAGKTVTWAEGSTFFRIPLDQIEFSAPKPDEEAKPESKPAEKPKVSKKDKPAKEETKGDDKSDDRKKLPKLKPEIIAVNLTFPRHTPSGTVALRGARIITMKGDEVLENADILVKDNRIVAVGKSGSVTIPAEVKSIDASGQTIVPGFIDIHPHWTEIRRGVLDLQNWSFLANLAYGVTAGRDPQTATNDMFAYQDLVDTGDILGPRAYSTGPGIFPFNDFQSAEEADDVVRRYKDFYRTAYIKSYLVGNRKQRQWTVMACKKEGIMPTTEGGLDMKLDLTHAIDGYSGNEHSLPITPLFDDTVQFWSRSGIFYTPTLIVAYGGPWAEDYFYENTEVHDDPKVRRFHPHNLVDDRTRRRRLWVRKDELVFPRLAAQDAKIIAAGGHVCIGSHGQFQGLGYHWEMWALASGGASNMEVLRSATLEGAKAIGLAQDLGSLEPGKLADFVVLDKNPLDDIHNTNTIHYVMKNGELFDGNTLDEVYPEQKPLAPLWWWNEKP